MPPPPPKSLLLDEYKRIQKSVNIFPQTAEISDIQEAMICYQDFLKTQAQRKCCGCCGRRKLPMDVTSVDTEDPDILYYQSHYPHSGFDKCAIHKRPSDKADNPTENPEISAVNLCKECLKTIQGRKQAPKFSGCNFVNTILCQDYPPELQGLSKAEEALCARAHVVGIFLKLPGKAGNDEKGDKIFHRGSRGHMISIKQDPSALLTLLPCATLGDHTTITVMWEGLKKPGAKEMAPFLTVRKQKVIEALKWFCKNSPAYKDIKINKAVLATWPEEPFVPQEFVDAATYTDTGYTTAAGREAYATSFSGDGFLNELDKHLGDVDDGTIVSTSAFTDGHGMDTQHNQSLFATLDVFHQKLYAEAPGTAPPEPEHEDSAFDDTDDEQEADWIREHDQQGGSTGQKSSVKKDIHHIKYKAARSLLPKSAYTSPDYFPSAFPTLFPYGIGGHSGDVDGKRSVPVGIASFAKWTMEHHSRR